MVSVSLFSRTLLVLGTLLTIQSEVNGFADQSSGRSLARLQRRRGEASRGNREYSRPRRRVRKNNISIRTADYIDLDRVILNAPLPALSQRQYREVSPRRSNRKTLRPRVRTEDDGIVQLPIRSLSELPQESAPRVRQLPLAYARKENLGQITNLRPIPEESYLPQATEDGRPTILFDSREAPSIAAYETENRKQVPSNQKFANEFPPFKVPFSEPIGGPEYHPHHRYEDQAPQRQQSKQNYREEIQPYPGSRPRISAEHIQDFERKQEESLQKYQSQEAPQNSPYEYEEPKPVKVSPYRDNIKKYNKKTTSPFSYRKKTEDSTKKLSSRLEKESYANEEPPRRRRRPSYTETDDSFNRPSYRQPVEQENVPNFGSQVSPIDESFKYKQSNHQKRSSLQRVPVRLQPVYASPQDETYPSYESSAVDRAADEPVDPFSRSFGGDDKIEKRQALHGHEGYTDPNGIAFAENAAHAEHGHSGDGRLAFQLHGQKGPHSYRFGFDTGKGPHRQFRYEEKDNDGTVKGRFGYYDSKGKLQIYNYSAHPHHGYSAVEAH